LETRRELEGTLRRRRGCYCGNLFNTFEITDSVYRDVGTARMKAAIMRGVRGTQRRSRAKLVRSEVTRLLGEKWKATAIAHELGITEARVRQLKGERR